MMTKDLYGRCYMRLFSKTKDGGNESPVEAYFLIEWKGLFSIALLKFNKGGREAFHSHAFNAYTWFIKGELREETLGSNVSYKYTRSILPKCTPKNKTHRVKALRDSWCLTFRGGWENHWTEYCETTNTTTLFSHGRCKDFITEGNYTLEQMLNLYNKG